MAFVARVHRSRGEAAAVARPPRLAGRPAARAVARLALLGAAAAAYVLGAWPVPPGFFDGFAPPAPYRWVSPPPELRAGNQPPTSGRATIGVQNGAAQAGHVYTTDQQAAITFPSQSFEAPANGSSITLEIKPVASYPDLGGIVPAGNVYLVTASTRLISPVVLTLRYGSQQSNPPGQVFAAESSSAPWRSIGSINSAVPYTVAASTQTLGYFVAGFPPAPPSAPARGGSGGGSLPVIAVAVAAVAIAVLAGIPFLVRRGSVRSEPEAPVPPPAASRNLGGGRRGRRRGRR